MKANILKITAVLLLLTGSFSSCGKNEIDYSNIENLYEQPLHVIQKVVEGNWKLQYSYGGFAGQTIVDTHGSYMYLTIDHIIMGNDTFGVTTYSPIIWQWENGFFGGDSRGYLLTYNHDIYINEQDGVIYEEVPIFNTLVPCQIKNDTLVIGNVCCDGYIYYYARE